MSLWYRPEGVQIRRMLTNCLSFVLVYVYYSIRKKKQTSAEFVYSRVSIAGVCVYHIGMFVHARSVCVCVCSFVRVCVVRVFTHLRGVVLILLVRRHVTVGGPLRFPPSFAILAHRSSPPSYTRTVLSRGACVRKKTFLYLMITQLNEASR